MPFELTSLQLTVLALVLFVAVFLAVLFYYLYRHWYHSKVILPRALDWVFLEIQMPKESSEKVEEMKNKGEEEKKTLIAVAEQLFTTISHLSSVKFFKPNEYVSFEIACVDKKVSFFVNCPKHVQELIEKQIQAQYPQAFIEEVEVYNPFQKGGELDAAELKPSKKYYYPVRTYKTMESDPLSSLTNAMSKLDENEGAAIQIIISPATDGWQAKPRHMALEVQQGKNPHIVERGPIYRALSELFYGLSGQMWGKNKNQMQQQNRHDLSGMSSPIHLTPMQQEIVKKLEEKASRSGYRTNIRIITSSTTPGNAHVQLNNFTSVFFQ
jgi:hypothetical protein